MNDLGSKIWQDPFEQQTHHLWLDNREHWKINSLGLIHENETFGKLEVFQRNEAVFEVRYEGWFVQLMPDTAKIVVLQRSEDKIPAFYMYERIALPILRLIRGCLLLHASCVDMDGKCVVFLAQTGVGKTSLAGALLKYPNHRLVAEDTLALLADSATFYALPGADYLAVRHHLLDDLEGISAVEDMENKRILHIEPGLCRKVPMPVAALMILASGDNGIPVQIDNKQEALTSLLCQQMAFSNVSADFKRLQFRWMMELIRQLPVFWMNMDLSCDEKMKECVKNLRKWRLRA